MTVTVRIPTVLRRYAEDLPQVVVEGESLGTILNNLTVRYPDIRKHLYDGQGNLRSFVNVYLNDRNIRELGGDHPVGDGDELSIVPAVAGG